MILEQRHDSSHELNLSKLLTRTDARARRPGYKCSWKRSDHFFGFEVAFRRVNDPAIGSPDLGVRSPIKGRSLDTGMVYHHMGVSWDEIFLSCDSQGGRRIVGVSWVNDDRAI
jgi:hypothetical protein